MSIRPRNHVVDNNKPRPLKTARKVLKEMVDEVNDRGREHELPLVREEATFAQLPRFSKSELEKVLLPDFEEDEEDVIVI